MTLLWKLGIASVLALVGAVIASSKASAAAPPSGGGGGGGDDKTTPRHFIAKGSTGSDVSVWRRVVGLGDGQTFDDATEAATMAWQTQHGLTADGKVGHDSWTTAGFTYASGAAAPAPAKPGPVPPPVQASVGPVVSTSSGGGDGGHVWAKSLPKEDAMAQGDILAAFDAGHGVYTWVKLTLTDGTNTLVIDVLARALRIGTQDDSVAVVVDYNTAQALAERMGAYLLTPHVSDKIFATADLKIFENGFPPSRPWQGTGTDETGTFTTRMIEHSDQMDKKGVLQAHLAANEGKDWVISLRIWTDPAAKRHNGPNYGFYLPNGDQVQHVGMVHNRKHVDYSQKLRLMRKIGMLNGQPVDLRDVVRDQKLAALLSSEGRLPDLIHPDLGGMAA